MLRLAGAVLLLLILGTALPTQAQSPATLSYQGYLEDGGTPVDDGNATLTFRLFDAATGGSPLWSETHNGVDVEGGLFEVTLGAVNPINSLEFYRPLWVEVEVGEGAAAQTLSPRTPLAASAYTMGLVLPILQDASVGGTALTINNTGAGDGIKGDTQHAGGRGVVGVASAFTGGSYGVYGVSQSEAGAGVYGWASTGVATQPNYGVYGEASSATGIGVQGEHNDGSFGRLGTASYGAYGEHVDGNVGYLGGSFAAARGTHSNGNFGTLGREDAGAWGHHDAAGNSGYLGTVDTGVSGTNGNGNLGQLAHAAYGVLGSATNGNAGRFQTLGTSNTSAVLSVAGTFDSANLLEGYLGSNRQFEFGIDGSLSLYDVTGQDLVAQIDASNGSNAGALSLYRNGTSVINLDADYNGDSRVTTQELEITGGSDLAEPFDVAPAPGRAAPEAGMVVTIDPETPGRLAVSDGAYDPLVAGVISGAGGIETGLLLRQEGSIADGAVPVALVGRVYVRVDASYGPVRPGDLLTTSPTPGHAMRVTDRARAHGAVLGKAMTALDEGTGLVLVLVSLQ
ncbi:MAG: hypothetical protein GVY18_17515 [Bacteroidetes bacterium]|nr:hypothetical protein [Bacteroidota bacterium]